MARFPYRITLESFDYGFQPAVDRKKLQDLATGRFLEHGENIVFLGPPGTGNTHLAIGLGLKAVQQGHRTLFTSALSLIATLTKAYADNRFEDLCSAKMFADIDMPPFWQMLCADQVLHERFALLTALMAAPAEKLLQPLAVTQDIARFCGTRLPPAFDLSIAQMRGAILRRLAPAPA
jgi:hypothetical protein